MIPTTAVSDTHPWLRLTPPTRAPLPRQLVTYAMLNALCRAGVATAWLVTFATDMGVDGNV